MSRLDHGRPMFKAIDAGGGERIRTIAEELRGSRPRASAKPGPCRSCRAVRQLTEGVCRACRADRQLIASAGSQLQPKRRRKANAQGRLKSVELVPSNIGKAASRRQVEEARARIKARRSKNVGAQASGGAGKMSRTASRSAGAGQPPEQRARTRRDSPRSANGSAGRSAVCPSCFTEMPVTGTCAYCC